MKNITLDLTTLQFCTPEMLDRYRKEIPLMADYQPEEGVVPTNSQVLSCIYRALFVQLACGESRFGLDYQPERSHDVWSTYSSLLLLPKQSLERIRTYPVGHLRPFAGNGSQVDLKVYQYSD